MMLTRNRPMKSHLSGASGSRVPPEIAENAAPSVVPVSDPHAHGLLVALVSAPEAAVARLPVPAWPLWLVPGAGRRSGRADSRTSTPVPRE